MSPFEEIMSRLKHSLRVSKDQEVADAIGMKKAAFSSRKTRNAFPEKELRILAIKRPELGIDVDYVLHGERRCPEKMPLAATALECLQRRFADLKADVELMGAINQQLQQNWLLAQGHINLLTSRYNELALVLADLGVYEINTANPAH